MAGIKNSFALGPEGQPIAGDRDELMALVRQWRTIQVGIRQLFGLVEGALEGPEHISFLTTMQPLIRDGHVQSNCDLVVVGAPRWPIVWARSPGARCPRGGHPTSREPSRGS